MRKEIKFSAVLDTSTFDQSIADLQRKMAQSQTATRLQQAGFMSPQTAEHYRRTTSADARDLDRSIKDQVKWQNDLSKIIDQRSNLLKKLQSEQQKLNKDTAEYIKLQETIGRVSENNSRLRAKAAERDKSLNQALDLREAEQAARKRAIFERNEEGWGLARRYAGQGMYGPAAKQAYGAMGGIGGIVGGIGAIGGALGSVGAVGEHLSGYGIRLEQAKGSAIQGTIGQDLGAVYRGKSPFEAMFLQEREKAAGLAEQKENRSRIWDRVRGIVGAATLGAGAIGLGSIVAAPFTGGASLMGLGAAGALLGGGAVALSSDRAIASLTNQKEYDQLLASQRAKDFRETLENLKAQDPQKKLVIEDFEQNYLRNLSVQRTLGISNRQFYGQDGLLQRSASAGFMPEQAVQMAQGIVGAGGSARMGQNAEFGLQMQRAGLTNSQQILGTLSGSLQNPEANKRAVVSIISEAFQIGLDNTDFAEEQRRFSQAAANIIARTGATGEDQDRIAGRLGGFVAEKTNVGIEAAKTAYERFQERGSSMSGRRGAIRMMDLMNDPELSGLTALDKSELLSLPPEQLSKNDEMLQYYAGKAKISPEELIEKIGRGTSKSRFLLSGSNKEVSGFQETISDYMKSQGIDRTGFLKQLEEGKLSPEASQAFGGIEAMVAREEGPGISKQQRRAMAMEMFPGGPIAPSEERKEATREMLKGVGERIEDRTQAQAAEGADKLRDAFLNLKGEIEKFLPVASKFTENITTMSDTAASAAEKNRQSLQSGDPYAGFGVRAVTPNARNAPSVTGREKK